MRSLFVMVVLLFIGISLPLTAHAQESAASSQPLEISASKSLEWHRNDNMYIANGDAYAKQGDTTIKARRLEAFYRDDKASGQSMQIWKIIAYDHVEITASNGKVFGDKAVYNLDESRAVMTGKKLRMESDQQTLTANDKFEYFTQQNKLIAKGNAKLKRPTDTLESQDLIAWFKDGDSSRELHRAQAIGNVVITTDQEKIKGDKGEYRKDQNRAEIIGNVIITRGQNILKGNRAELDLTTNISRIFGAPNAGAGTSGRVSGTFYPGSTDKPSAQP